MADPDITQLLDASIARVWNEHDDEQRLRAMADIYHVDARIYEPTRMVTGHEAISKVVAGVLADMPPGFRFEVTGPTLGHHDMVVTRWQGGPPGQVIVKGADAARIVDGRIHEHWFFFEPAAADAPAAP
ncbi:nuclear transport factor 2 family protein [Sphingomonas sp.]|jgi:predicted SnoaL-like aldol condensation-catalyzing enzyme|uniref:nuclear transport factor 2 family protein n=1 Tax=Sphingomonas sp. TaxID=28214 RepID=UPI003B3A11F8